ncbi:MAG: hypothetical protein JWP92_1708 [Caulobacter sp.]|nr:hypothetical protein [Caulobacter sp.]
MRFQLLTVAALAASIVAPSARAADYVALKLTTEVAKPATAVWARVGDYCAIAEWLDVKCAYESGSGGLGTVRKIRDDVLEPMVGQTPMSYTYWQSVGNMAAYGYHGTLGVEPAGAQRSRIVYTLVYDQAAMASDEQRQQQRARLTQRFQGAVDKMKQLAEAP